MFGKACQHVILSPLNVREVVFGKACEHVILTPLNVTEVVS